MSRVFAAADIGSNTVHLLIAETDGKSVTRLDNESIWVSLGETVTREGLVPPDLEANLIGSLRNFKRLAKARKAEYVYVFATEAMRLAKNHEDVIAKVLEDTGLVVDLISPRREAELGLLGTMLDSPHNVDLALEVGGGSAQISRA